MEEWKKISGVEENIVGKGTNRTLDIVANQAREFKSLA